jgi:hypothetical protein
MATYGERDEIERNNPEWNTPNALAAKELTERLLKFKRENFDENEVRELISSYSPEVLNSRFRYEKSFETFNGASCLFVVIERMRPDIVDNIVRILLESGADPNIAPPNDFGHGSDNLKNQSILGLACYIGYYPIVEMLLDAGADVNSVRGSENVMTIILDERAGGHYHRSRFNNVNQIIPLLYERGFNICLTEVPESVRNNRTGLYQGDIVYHEIDMLERAIKLLKYYDNKAKIALPLILDSCYRDLIKVPFKVNGEIKMLPRALYTSKLYENKPLNDMDSFENDRRSKEIPSKILIKQYKKLTKNIIEEPVKPEDIETINVTVEKGEYGDKGSLYDVIGAEYVSAESIKNNPSMIGLYQELKCPTGSINYKGTCIVEGLIKGDIVDVNGNRMTIPNTNIAYLREKYPAGTYLAKENRGKYKLQPVNVTEIDEPVKDNEENVRKADKRKFDTLQEGEEHVNQINPYENWRSIVDKNGQVTHFFNLTFPAMKQSKQNFVMIKNSNGTINEDLVNKFIPVTEDEYNELIKNKRIKQNAGKRTSKNKKVSSRITKKRRLKRITKRRRNIKRKSIKKKIYKK